MADVYKGDVLVGDQLNAQQLYGEEIARGAKDMSEEHEHD